MQQLDRAKRYLIRIQKLYQGVFSSTGHDKDAYDDDVISFFIHCYHIRDWIIHLNESAITKKQVDEYINEHRALMICADLANGAKHCRLTRTLRTEKQPHVYGKERHASMWLTGDGGGEVMKCTYAILSNGEDLDALEVATACIQLWELFVNEFTHNNSLKRSLGDASRPKAS